METRSYSLKRRLSLLLAALFPLMGGALYLANLEHTRGFLASQLESHAQDAATTLALQLSPAFAAGDLAAVVNTVDALNDSGYYRRIALVAPDGRVIVERSQAVHMAGVPDWFIRRLPLTPPEGRAEALAGWRRAADIQVASHPGYAYRQLWDGARTTLAWTLAFSALAALLAVGLLHRALAGLAELERLATEAAEGRFGRLAALPKSRELHRIGRALDRMSEAVARMLAEKGALIERLAAELNHDAATGLANRAYLYAALDTALPAPRAGLALMQVGGLEEINARLGRAEGDRLLAAVATVAATVAGRHGGLAARLGGAQFAVFVEHADALAPLADELAEASHLALVVADGVDVHVGAASAAGADRPALLARADAALRDARLGASGTARLAGAGQDGREELLRQLRATLAADTLDLAWQPLLGLADGRPEHHEAYARLAGPDGGLLPAGSFVTLAEQTGLATDLDAAVLARALAAPAPAGRRSVNLSAASLARADLAGWLRRLAPAPERLSLEVTPGQLAAQPGALPVLRALSQAGYGIVLDRFLPQAGALALLAELAPDWVKVEGALCRRAGRDAGSRALLRTLCEYGHELGVRVAACHVEGTDELALLRELGFDAAQGHGLAVTGR